MNLQSLGFKSEMIFLNFDGKVEDRHSYMVIRTLTNPNYFWGNLLVFDHPPQKGDYLKWVEIFKHEFTDPRIYHVTLAWDCAKAEASDASEFIANGYELQATEVLATGLVNEPPKYNSNMEVRTIDNQEEWNEVIKLQVDSALDNLPKQEWEKFYISQSQRYQAMIKAGLGNWYGGYLNGKLVAALGIFHQDGIGRFQTVCTHPEYRRQGLCGTLVYKSSLHALNKLSVKTLVMCADPDYHAIKIYESVGFKRQQTEYGVYWWDKTRNNS